VKDQDQHESRISEFPASPVLVLNEPLRGGAIARPKIF
jgi:hypothetical protein